MKRHYSKLGARLLCGAAAVAILSGAGMAQAEERAQVRFDIPAQPLTAALNQFGIQSGSAILFKADVTGAKVSKPFTGAADPEMALAMMLDGTGLSYRREGQAFVIVSASDPQSGSAAGDGADGTVQALIVTAQKREENIQDVPIAMSAFTQEALERSQVAGGPDLMTQIPNMTFTKTNFSSYSIQIRGIGTQAISATTDPAVAIAFNNTPFVRNRFFEQEFYDLERVEVLRGPQGTLYGRNATAGVVNIISAKPKFTYQAKLSADVANYNSTRLEGMINLPLVDDRVALRIAGAWTKRDGFATNELTGNPIDGRDLWSTRTTLRFVPNDRLSVNLIWEHFQEDDDRLRSGKQLCQKDIVTEVGGLPVTYTGRFPGSQATFYQSQLSQGCKPASLYAPESFQTPNGFQLAFYHPLSAIGLPKNRDIPALDPYVNQTQSRDLRVIESMVDPIYKAKNDTVELQFSYDLTDNLALSSETAWASDMVWSMEDYNRFNTNDNVWASTDDRPGVLNNGVFCDPQIGCSNRLIILDLSTGESRQFSQEFRLASNYEGAFNFSLGANFTRLDSIDKYYVFANAFNLWAASSFATGIDTPYVANVSDNHECLSHGVRTISLNNSGGVGVAGQCNYIDPNPIQGVNDLSHNYFLSKNPYKLISYAVFGEVYYNITDNLKLTAGLRWTVDKKDAPRIPSWVLASDVGYPVAEIIRQEWREPTGRLALDWKPDLSFTDETLVYGSFAHGYKAGGANPPVAGVALNVRTANGAPTPSATHPTTFDPEFVNAYEIGTKNTLLDGRLTLNLDAFYYDYTDYQISQIIDRSALNTNFDAKIWGAELEADWRPLENLRLGLKLGYENTRVADGEKAVDVMDRSDGNRVGHLPDGTEFHWIVVKPFPIYPSNCVMPDWLWIRGNYLNPTPLVVSQVGNVAGSADGPCDMAYFRGLDPFTMQPYVPNPSGGPNWSNGGFGAYYPNYPGYDPASAPNNGEGFDKDLSGNALPNAPHFTATITGDYTVPLPNDWLMTLHTDLYYQSEAWTRIFNTPGYDKLKAYTNVNLAAIFTNQDAGWKVMAYVKNVMDRDSITGAFLNSDDTGLTTNVFLTEPRLYGLRVTKEFDGGPWWTGANRDHPANEPYPLTVEIGGQVQRQDAPYEPLRPSFADQFPADLDNLSQAQNTGLDHGDGRDFKITYRPNSGPWRVSAGVRFGRVNGSGPLLRTEQTVGGVCAYAGAYAYICDLPAYQPGAVYFDTSHPEAVNFSGASSRQREEHTVADFAVGRDVGIGGLVQSTFNVGVRYAQLKSSTHFQSDATPDWDIPEGSKLPGYFDPTYWVHHTHDLATLDSDRQFKGAGPVVVWDASHRLLGDELTGKVNVDWSVGGGVLFGKQKASVMGYEEIRYYAHNGFSVGSDFSPPPYQTTRTPVDIRRSKAATVPVANLSLGLSYDIQRLKLSAGYQWERYFDVLDVGDETARKADRTIDGPYFKIAVGFGG